MAQKPRKRRIADRDRRRIETIRKRKGPNWFHDNAKRAGKFASPHNTSEKGRAAANARWQKHREEKGVTGGSNNS